MKFHTQYTPRTCSKMHDTEKTKRQTTQKQANRYVEQVQKRRSEAFSVCLIWNISRDKNLETARAWCAYVETINV